MPQERKKRGRRGGGRRNEGEGDGQEQKVQSCSTNGQESDRPGTQHAPSSSDESHPTRKRIKDGRPTTADDGEEDNSTFAAAEHRHRFPAPTFSHVRNGEEAAGAADAEENPFYGLLTPDEQEYFKRADDTLEADQFSDADDRALFLQNVYREAAGKELKMACSQSCSRLVERLIALSTANQLKALYGKFADRFLHLVQHRFASHCCEALFIRSAAVVAREMTSSVEEDTEESQTPPPAPPPSMEQLLLATVDELQDHLGYLMTQKFASHTFRVLLFTLSGEPFAHTHKRSILESKKKEHVSVNGGHRSKDDALIRHERPVPESFKSTLTNIIEQAVSGLTSSQLQVLATHKTGNPTLQLLLRLEMSLLGKQRAREEQSLIRKLLPDDPIADSTESAVFIRAMLYDSVSSRLLETIVDCAPGWMFKGIYSVVFVKGLGTFVKNETASYVACKVLERLGKEDLESATAILIPHIDMLVDRNRLVVLRTLVERNHVREADSRPLASALQTAYSGPNGFDVARLLKLGEACADQTLSRSGSNKLPMSSSQAHKLHGSLLAQAMINVPGALSDMVFDGLIRMGIPLALSVARDPIASRALQAALTCTHASIIFRRKMIQQFYGQAASMALDPPASRIVDAVWNGTAGLAFIRERFAEELAENEAALKQSHVGRAVWRNWKMDLYRRRPADWVQRSRQTAGNDGFPPFPDALSTPGTSPLKNTDEGTAPRTTSAAAGRNGHANATSATTTAASAMVPASRASVSMKVKPKEQDDMKRSGRHRTALDIARAKFAANRIRAEKQGHSQKL